MNVNSYDKQQPKAVVSPKAKTNLLSASHSIASNKARKKRIKRIRAVKDDINGKKIASLSLGVMPLKL